MAFDQSQLRRGCLELKIVSGIMRDGTPFDAPYISLLPLERAVPRLNLTLRDKARERYQCICLGRIADVSDETVVRLDQSVPPLGFVLNAHRAYEGYLKAVTGSVEARLEAFQCDAEDRYRVAGCRTKII